MSVQPISNVGAAISFINIAEQPAFQYTREEFIRTLDADSDDDGAYDSDLSKDWRTLSNRLDEILKDQPATQEKLVATFMGVYSRYLPKDQVELKETYWLFMQDILPEGGVDRLADFYATLDQAPDAQKTIRESKFATLFGIK